MKTRMDPGFAVFNLHINDAGKKADREIKRAYGKAAFDEHIKPLHKAGIMSIFNKPPQPITSAWVALVTYIVNAK